MRNKKPGPQPPRAGQAARGQAAGGRSGGSFVLGVEGADLARDAARDGGGEAPTDGGVLAAELVWGWWHKDVVGFGEKSLLLAQTKLNPPDLGWFWRLVRAPRDSPRKIPPYEWKMLTIKHLLAVMWQSGSVTRKATDSLYIALTWVSCWLVLTAIFRPRLFIPSTFLFFFFFPPSNGHELSHSRQKFVSFSSNRSIKNRLR